jgi:chromosome segregation ATPase
MSTKRQTSQAGVLGSLQQFNGKLEANSTDLAHLEGSRAKFRTLLARIDELSKEQGAMTARKQEASKQIQALLVESQRLGSGLRMMVKEHYGPRSEKLSEFGLQPFRGRKAKAPAPETPGTPAPTPPLPAAAKD